MKHSLSLLPKAQKVLNDLGENIKLALMMSLAENYKMRVCW
jgi:hypothetical protein